MLNKHFEMPGVTMHEQQLTPQKRALSEIGIPAATGRSWCPGKECITICGHGREDDSAAAVHAHPARHSKLCGSAITSLSSSNEGTCPEAVRRFYVAAMTTSMRFGSPLAIPASMLGAMSLARVTR